MAQWLERVAPVIPSDNTEERAILAAGYRVLADRTKDPAHKKISQQMFDELMARKDVPPITLLAGGMAAERDKDFATAEKAYRKAIELNPKLAEAKNNLAMIIVNRGGDTAEAMTLAKSAVADQPGSAILLDTLAAVQAKAKDVDGALATLKRALQIEPQSLQWRVHMGRYLLDAGKHKEAQDVLMEIAALQASGTTAPDDVKTEIKSLKEDLDKQSASVAPAP
jgi:Tfp pilus assembly protein PilF